MAKEFQKWLSAENAVCSLKMAGKSPQYPAAPPFPYQIPTQWA